MSNYQEFYSRNNGLISEFAQVYISQITVLIAGCGMGSMSAENLARLGVVNFVLVDPDTVSVSNLNRQAFSFQDVGTKKTLSLSRRLKAINPMIKTRIYSGTIDENNCSDLLDNVDIVVDTIDFLDFEAILCLHDEVTVKKIPIITAINAGQGAFVMASQSVNSVNPVKQLLKIKSSKNYSNDELNDIYYDFLFEISSSLDEKVLPMMKDVFDKMKLGEACPASQLSVGSYLVASIVSSYVIDIAEGNYSLNYFPIYNVINLKKTLNIQQVMKTN